MSEQITIVVRAGPHRLPVEQRLRSALKRLGRDHALHVVTVSTQATAPTPAEKAQATRRHNEQQEFAEWLRQNGAGEQAVASALHADEGANVAGRADGEAGDPPGAMMGVRGPPKAVRTEGGSLTGIDYDFLSGGIEP